MSHDFRWQPFVGAGIRRFRDSPQQLGTMARPLRFMSFAMGQWSPDRDNFVAP
jgi:hypothetical protein